MQEVSSGRPRALEGQNQEKATTNGTASAVFQPKHSVASTPTINVKSESCLSAASNPFLLVPPKGSSVKRDAKVLWMTVHSKFGVSFLLRIITLIWVDYVDTCLGDRCAGKLFPYCGCGCIFKYHIFHSPVVTIFIFIFLLRNQSSILELKCSVHR